MPSPSLLRDHPLSPDPSQHPTQPLFPEPCPILIPHSPAAAPSTSTTTSSPSPLFPASPAQDEHLDESVILATRRASAATLPARQGDLHLPSSLSSASLARSISVGTTISTIDHQDDTATHDPPLPKYLAFPSAPHLLPPSTLASLPPSHLLALVAALSKENEDQQLELVRKGKECDVLVGLAREAKVGEGEIERARVRARVGVGDEGEDKKEGERKKDWRIELRRDEVAEEEEEDRGRKGGVAEILLNLDDLAEAISENAFDFGTSPTSSSQPFPSDDNASSLRAPISEDGTADDSASISRNSISSSRSTPDLEPPQSTSAPMPKPGRQRHASLSSRLFGSFSLSHSPPPALLSPPIPNSPSSASGLNLNIPPSTSPASKSKRRHHRSDSIKSVASTASGASSIGGEGAEGKGGYGEWIGWKGWGRGGKDSMADGRKSALGLASSVQGEEEEVGETGSFVEEPEEEDGSERGEREVTPERGEETQDAEQETPGESELTTPMPNSSLGFFALSSSAASPSSPTRRRGQSDASSSTSPRRLDGSPPPDSLLSVSSIPNTLDTSTTSTSDDEPPLSPRSHNGRRVSTPSSPTLTRPKGRAAPALNSQNVTASPSLALTTPVPTSTLSQPSAEDGESLASSSLLKGEPSSTEDEEDDHEGDNTLKARRRSSGSRNIPPFLSVATPLYSASTDGIPQSKSHKDLSYVSSAKGAFGRALGLGASVSSSSSSTSTGSTGMKRSQSDGIRRSTTTTSLDSPNLTLFPKLSRYSPFAQPALSTPSTSVSLSSHSTSLLAPTSSSLSSPVPSNAPTTMELSTISGEAAPPTFALQSPNSFARASEKEGGKEDGPLVDRYGFVYDVRSGMKLLREARRRKDRLARGDPSSSASQEEEEALRAAAALIEEAEVEAGRDELEKELEAMRVAMGLPLVGSANSPTTSRSPAPKSPIPSLGGATDKSSTSSTSSPLVPTTPTGTPSLVPPPSSSSTSNGTTTTLAPQPHRPTRLIRSPSSSSNPTPTRQPGPQSMKLLLTTLKDMSDALEHAQKIAWDSFIQRRQEVLATSTSKNGGNEDKSSSKDERRRRRRRAQDRPRTVMATGGGELVGEAFAAREASSEDLSEKAWSEDLVGVSQMGVAGKSGKEDWAEFKELVRKGVPIVYRPKIWAECSGANEAREPGLYQELLAQHKSEENQCLNQIDMDCHRTFPTNVFFAGNGPGVAKLRNVLIAYSWRNPKIGYCQGMNNLTATLLLTHPAEEDAFWVLVCIIEKILPSDYYTSHLLVSQADQRVLRDLIERLHPDVAAHLEDLGVELPAVTFGWFLSLFTDALPIQTLLRVWDLIFVLGTVMLFRVAVAIIQMNHAEILACDSAASLYALMRSMTTHLYQVDKLLKIACEDLRPLIKDRDISVLRNKHVADLQVELGISPEESEEGEMADSASSTSVPPP
ncbi:rab-GTPase-TBC domain-domain-containing protein [Leucosporidium creatinivorum]|uniref:Rab-GTPase-TBC domain-domain-containing protein n=1 Tax=Leucosporidium creatinivorum TaxID=106004 RepID=A0A1Y2ECX0_9BASI|nr:rab-GTPase-TBC domain-domain-containing protein [Leucosporidium creatinivorum]